MNYKTVKVELLNNIAIATMNRPQALNALNSDFFKDFNHFLDLLETNKEIRVVILTGEGKAFAAGADIAEMS
ncbi:MAG: enoyl-CoA hydratase/isomerase family protein, partial [Bacteroidales bacterium]